MMTRDDFVSAVTAYRGEPDQLEHFKGGIALHYGQASVTANDREISQNSGADWDRMVALRLSRIKGLRR